MLDLTSWPKSKCLRPQTFMGVPTAGFEAKVKIRTCTMPGDSQFETNEDWSLTPAGGTCLSACGDIFTKLQPIGSEAKVCRRLSLCWFSCRGRAGIGTAFRAWLPNVVSHASRPAYLVHVISRVFVFFMPAGG